jgi:hypothetical protein
MNELQIDIQPHSEGGFSYDIFTDLNADSEAVDGGICTSDNMTDAIEMALDGAKRYYEIHREKTKEDYIIKHKALHSGLDQLLACFITENPKKSLQNVNLMEFLQWSSEQTANPSCYKNKIEL